MLYTLPFRKNSPYSFTSNAGGNQFKFHIKHAMSDDTYYMDIDIFQNGKYVPIINSVKLTCGCDLFIPYKRYGLGTFMVIPTDSRYYNLNPNADSLIPYYVIVWEHD